MNGLGTRVIQLYRGEQILRGFDDDLRAHLAGAMRDRGIVLEVGRDILGIEKVEDGLAVRVDNGETHVVDQVLFATGRNPEHGRPRARGAGGRDAGERGGRGGPVVADGGAVDLRGRRRHRPARADAGGDRGGAGLRRDGLRGAAAPGGPQPGADRGLHQAGGGGGRADRGRGGEARPGRELRDPLPSACQHALGAIRAHADEARGRPRAAARCSASTSSAPAPPN